MTEQTCQCGRPTSGATLCPHCATTLEYAVANISSYYRDLETLRTKQTRYGNGAATKGSIGKAQPLGMDLRFAKAGVGSEIDHDTRSTVIAWCRIIMGEEANLEGPWCRHACLHTSCANVFRRRYPKNTVPSMCAYLQRQLRYITNADWADEILDEMLDLEHRLARLVDRPADRWYAGRCSVEYDAGEGEMITCDAELYALAEKGHIDCPRCGIRHDVHERREFLLAEAREVHVTATEAAGALIAWTDYDGSMTKLVDRIAKWRDRDKLEVRDVTSLLGKDRHLYRLGDIEVLLMKSANDTRLRSETVPA